MNIPIKYKCTRCGNVVTLDRVYKHDDIELVAVYRCTCSWRNIIIHKLDRRG